MKSLRTTLAIGSLVAFSYAAQATTYTDATGENFTGAGGGILDISSVEVTDTLTDLIFKINLTGNPSNPTDWGKYMIGINSTPGGNTTGNGWGRPISISAGMDYWVGSWVDSGNGAELYKYTGVWGSPQSATYGGNPDNLAITKNTSSVTLQFSYAGLGLSAGDTFSFDVYTSAGGAGDGAVDALGNPSQTIADWGNAYNSGSLVSSYTITPIPEPSALALIGLGGALLARRLIRRKV